MSEKSVCSSLETSFGSLPEALLIPSFKRHIFHRPKSSYTTSSIADTRRSGETMLTEYDSNGCVWRGRSVGVVRLWTKGPRSLFVCVWHRLLEWTHYQKCLSASSPVDWSRSNILNNIFQNGTRPQLSGSLCYAPEYSAPSEILISLECSVNSVSEIFGVAAFTLSANRRK
jgi:hypothetical protein